MESVTFVYALATEQERQTEALKNQNQNQLEKYRALLHKQMEKETAFLSFKKVEFLSRQEAKLGGKRPLSARARMGECLPEISPKSAPKNRSLRGRNETRNTIPSIYRQTTHLGMSIASSKPKSSNTSPEEERKPCFVTLTGSGSNLASSRTNNQKERKTVHFGKETKVTLTRSIPKSKKVSTSDSPKEIETLGKRGITLPKCEKLVNASTKAHVKERVSDHCNYLKDGDRGINDHSRTKDSHNFGKAEDTPTQSNASWAVVARLIGLKMKFKRRKLHGTFQAPELEVLDPSLNKDSRFGQEKSVDPWEEVKDCRYLRLPNNLL